MSACEEAAELGCRLLCEHGRWHWSYGTHARSSGDHYGLSFASPKEAALHFLRSREGLAAAKRKARLSVPH